MVFDHHFSLKSFKGVTIYYLLLYCILQVCALQSLSVNLKIVDQLMLQNSKAEILIFAGAMLFISVTLLEQIFSVPRAYSIVNFFEVAPQS